MKGYYWYGLRINKYGYWSVCRSHCFLWIIPYKTVDIEGHHNIQSAKEHLKELINKK